MIVVVVCFSHDIASSSSSSKSFKCKRRLLFFCSLNKVFEEKCRTFFFLPLSKESHKKRRKKKSDLNPKPLFCLGY